MTVLLRAGAFLLAALAPIASAVPPAPRGPETPAPVTGRGVPDGKVEQALRALKPALPPGWRIARVERRVTPTGWRGEPRATLIRLENGTVRYPHDAGFAYHPFWKIWLLPRDWDGRMDVMPLDGEAAAGLLLGEDVDCRVLARSLGRNDWADGAEAIARALGLDALPLPPRAAHTIDAAAMQRLYLRLDSATGGRPGRWIRQIYGIAELPDLVYVELLTWDMRSGGATTDPTSLGEPAEGETRFLAREIRAAFPDKAALYLRRVTERSFGDVLQVAEETPETRADWSGAIPGGSPPDGERASCDGS